MTDDVAVRNYADLPVSFDDMAADANLGGKMGVQDVAIPYLYVLQSMSPQVNPDNAKFIPGAQVGMFLLTALDKVYDGRNTGLDIVLCHYERLFVEWRQREAGGGFVAWHNIDDPITEEATVNERGIPTLPNGNILTETAYHYVLVSERGKNEWRQAIMPLKSTGLKVSRKINYELATTYIPNTQTVAPRFLYKWHMTSVKETRDQYTWSNAKLVKEEILPGSVYKMAKEFAVMASKGVLRKAIHEEASEGENPTAARPSAVRGLDDEVPF